jgi:hypothetical protein
MRQHLATHGVSLELVGEGPAFTPRWLVVCLPKFHQTPPPSIWRLVRCPSNRVRFNERYLFIAASQFKQHEQETLDVRVLFTPY